MKQHKMAQKAIVAKKMTLKRAERRGEVITHARGSYEVERRNGNPLAQRELKGVAEHRRWLRYINLRDRVRVMSPERPEYYDLKAQLHGVEKELARL